MERAIRVYGYEDAPHGHAEVTLDNGACCAGRVTLASSSRLTPTLV